MKWRKLRENRSVLWSILFVALVFLSGCTKEFSDDAEGEGNVAISLSVSDKTITVTKAGDAQSEAIPAIADFKIEIINAAGRVLKTWERYADMPATVRIQVGQYTLRASHGEQAEAAFEAPYYEGNTPFTVTKSGTRQVSLTCYLANVKTTVDYKEGFKKYFKNYQVEVSTIGEKLLFAKGEQRVGYLAPGQLTALVTMTKQDDNVITFATPASAANGQEYYKFTFDVENGAGGTNLLVSFDETTAENPIKIDLNRSWVAHAAPFITPSGYTSAEEIKLFEGEKRSASLLATARNGILSCVVKTQSASLLAAGWPAEVDLVTADEAVKATLRSFGLKWTESLGNLNMAILDFSAVIPQLSCGEASFANHLFTVTVGDQMSQKSESSILNLKINKPLFNFLNTEKVFLNATEAPLTLSMPTGDIADVKLQYMDDWGKWKECAYDVVSVNEGIYELLVHVQFTNRPFTFRAQDTRFNRTVQTIVGVLLNKLQFGTIAPADLWSHKAYLTVEMQAGAEAAEVDIERLEGGAWISCDPVVISNDNNGTVHFLVENLSPNTEYTLRANYSGGQTSNQGVIRTESELSMPAFGSWSSTTYSTSKGGRYKPNIASGWNNAPNVNIYSYQLSSWATVNEKTVPAAPARANTWYRVPSTLPTADRNGNANAAILLQNVAWHNNGNSISDCGSDGFLQGSNQQIPPTNFLRSVGKLFLGAYNVVHNNSNSSVTETYEEGVAFTSRPARFKGFYKYELVGNDAPYIRVVIENRTGNTTTTLAELIIDDLEESSGYTAFERELIYTNTSLEATHLRVMFASSNKQNNSQEAENTSGIVTNNNMSDLNSVGSKFYIDAVSFSY